MKTKTFIKRLEDELGYVTDKSGNFINIRKEHGELGGLFAMVTINKVLGIDTSFHNFTSLDKHDQDLLFDLIQEYAHTPLEEREEEKKYQISLINNVVEYYSRGSYLNLRVDTGQYMMSASKETWEFQTQFTQREINNFPDDVKEILPLCKQIEVTP